MINQCAAYFNEVVNCEGQFVAEAGLCSKHMVLFEIWVDEHGGHRVYRTAYPRRWKRSIFHKWLNGIGDEIANSIYQRACKKPNRGDNNAQQKEKKNESPSCL